MEKLLLLAVNGLIWGSIIALIALGLPIIFGLLDIIKPRAIVAGARNAGSHPRLPFGLPGNPENRYHPGQFGFIQGIPGDTGAIP